MSLMPVLILFQVSVSQQGSGKEWKTGLTTYENGRCLFGHNMQLKHTQATRASPYPPCLDFQQTNRVVGLPRHSNTKIPRYMVLLYPGHFPRDGVMVGDAQSRHRDPLLSIHRKLWLPSPVSIRAVACVWPRKCLNGDNAGLDLLFEACCPVHCRLTDLQNLEHPVQWPVKLQERLQSRLGQGRTEAESRGHEPRPSLGLFPRY
ncbi:hypothetical protein B0T24DRAFT_604070 [Lasiosphaeria ovina]|uniref:Uncharacterized protein n=1 Tax=Lasiosphaeria ovina TaxID=92902 RepID=A0AAE0NKF9_9PEZI|nr:hypothetical protein B0T24DRAFT_604070 [Lasiosphaeria ovina]